MDLQLQNKLVLVTGSTAGIGKAAAEAFLAEGARVIVNGRTEEKVQSVVDELSKHGTVHGIAADLSNREQSRTLIEKTKQIGELDILVNNMGFFEVKEFADVSDEEWLEYFEVNVLSAVRLCRAFLPNMLKRNAEESSIWRVKPALSRSRR